MFLLKYLMLLFWFFSSIASSCTLTMGYRTTSRLPNINKAPDNSGLYLDLYTEATKRIGCQLKVLRQPKKRIIRGLKLGTIDFYPGFSFSEGRSKNIFYIYNGLPSKPVGLSRIEVPEIKSYNELRGKTLLMTLGAPFFDAQQYGISVKSPPELSFSHAFDLILNQKAYFFKDEIGISYYLKKHPRKNELKIHANCCGTLSEFTLGFSRKSPYYTELNNPDYNKDKALSVDNFPVKLSTETIAYKLQESISNMKKEGVIDALYQHYYGINPATLK